MQNEVPVAATVEKLYRREKALAEFGTFAFRETKLQAILDEAARVCAECLGVPFSKICNFEPSRNDLRVVAGQGWNAGVVGFAISIADETSPQGRAFTTGSLQLCPNIDLEYVSAFCNNLSDLYRATNIKLVCSTEPLWVDLDSATALGIIVTELVNNAFLHAFPDGAGEISVTLRVMSGRPVL